MALTDEARRILINATRGEQIVDACIISHPAVSEVLYITPYHPGFTFDGNFYQYVPMRVDRPASVQNLSQQFKIVIQDLNEIAEQYVDLIPFATLESAMFTAYSVRIDRNDEVTLADGPYNVLIREFTSEAQGVGFTAEPQSTNMTRCGERATFERTNGLLRQFT